MNIAPMQLKTYFITNVQVTANPTYNLEQGYKYHIQNLTSDVKYLVDEKCSRIWQVMLKIKYTPQKSENVPYHFSVDIVGFFEVNSSWPKDKMEALVRINAPAMLYSAAREFIAMVSGRGPWDSILLPTVNFVPKIRKSRRRPIKRQKVRNEQ